MGVNSDLRRSPRLQQNGYYNEDQRPCINYYQAPYRAHRRRRWHATAPPAGTAPPAVSFLTRHPFIALFCAIAVVSYASIYSPVLGEQPKMTKAQDAKILGSRSSKTYVHIGYVEKMINWFSPKYPWVLQDKKKLVPAFCWPFEGSGHLHVKLEKPVHISHVTIGHITKAQAPTGEIPSAPKLFSVYGLETSDDNGTLLGQFQYDANGPSFQTFPVASALQGAFKHVRLNVESNWGNPQYTCLYNFKVHWTPVQP